MSRALRKAPLQTGLHVENMMLCLQAARQHARAAGCPATMRKIRSALKSAEDARRYLARHIEDGNGNGVPSEHRRFCNFYRCCRCGNEWEDVWSATCDDDCRVCGARHMSPYRSDDAGGAP